MDRHVDFANVARVFEQLSGEFEKAKAERASSEALIASAEYELSQLKKSFLDARLERAAEPLAPAAAPVILAAKLRKPENWQGRT